MNVLYLNNTGSRWVVRDREGNKPKVKIHPCETYGVKETIIRTALQFQAFGNFVAVQYSFKGRKYWTLEYEMVETN